MSGGGGGGGTHTVKIFILREIRTGRGEYKAGPWFAGKARDWTTEGTRAVVVK